MKEWESRETDGERSRRTHGDRFERSLKKKKERREGRGSWRERLVVGGLCRVRED